MGSLKMMWARLRPGFLGVMVVLAMLLVACAEPIENGNMVPPGETPANGMEPQEVEVLMMGSQFSPQELTIQAGTTVLWYNDDTLPHTVTSDPDAGPDAQFDAELDPGESFSYTFNEPGTYSYFCSLHPGMEGTVTVQ
jgi:plastocyanin